jgi:hypothetical protein
MPFLLSLAGLALLFAGPLSAQLSGVNNAETCGRCHRDILKAWKSSQHARAMENPLFQDALERAAGVGGAAARQTCLECHAPTARHSGDLALKTKASWEGVTCDFCHSLKSVGVDDGAVSMTVRFDGTKTGPLKDAASGGHATAFSEVHTTSLVCAGCHEYRNPLGFPVLETYREWQDSSFGREGRFCQDCHMAQTAANVVDPKIKRSAHSSVNLHQMPGSRSIDQLNKAIALRMNTERRSDTLVVTVDLSNRGAGHMVPTGSPLRQLNLEVSVGAAGKTHEERRVYTRKVVDQAGKEINSEELVFLKAAKTVSDSRLKAGETRRESFEFQVPAAASARVVARLWYFYSPTAATADETRVNFLTLPAYVPAGRRPSN